MEFRVYLEIIRAVAVFIILLILIKKGKTISSKKGSGYPCIIAGFALIVFASLLDITDNFPALDKYVVIGDTPIQAILEKVVGYLLGFLMMALGCWKWLPAISQLQETRNQLQDSLVRETDLRHDIQNDRNHLFTTLHSIGDGVISTDTDSRIVLMNPTAEKLTGWSQSEAVGKPVETVFNIVNESTREPVDNPIAKVLFSGEIVGLANHTELIPKEGDPISIADSAAPVKNVNGEIVGVVLVFRNVTEASDLLNEKLKNQKLESLGVLAGGIAHDFNNLLMGIQGNISLALLAEGIDDDMVALLNDASQAARRAAALTSQLVTFSKGGDPHKDIVLISDTIKETANFILTGTVVKCEYSIDDDLWKTYADKGQVGQVIQNIVINASQAMGGDGEIHIMATNVEKEEAMTLHLEEKKYIHIKISDTGPGITKDNLAKIFDPYFSTKKEGSGLGLATSFSIIKKHGGLLVSNSAIGKGTTFSIYLPAEDNAVDDGGDGQKKAKSDKDKQRVALIMDDELLIRKLFSLMLRTFGYEVLQASHGEEALEIYKKSMDDGLEIDVVLLDLKIPGGMGGEETAKKLLEMDKDVKMIVASAYSDSPVLADFEAYGFCGALLKPFEPEDLKGLLNALL